MNRATIMTTALSLGISLLLTLVAHANEGMKYERDGATKAASAQNGSVSVNDAAPDFTLASYPDGDFSLADHRGHTVVLYFYPGDDTPICTAQAEAFRDRLEEFGQYGAMIFGVSPDSMESHKSFASDYGLPYGLLVDSGNRVRKLYGMPDGYTGWETRATYVIDGDGVVRHIIVDAEDIDKHIDESLAWAKKLDSERSQAMAQS
jgi:peroxiredoxin Q/BCP